jgi:hypothetical protein
MALVEEEDTMEEVVLLALGVEEALATPPVP